MCCKVVRFFLLLVCAYAQDYETTTDLFIDVTTEEPGSFFFLQLPSLPLAKQHPTSQHCFRIVLMLFYLFDSSE